MDERIKPVIEEVVEEAEEAQLEVNSGSEPKPSIPPSSSEGRGKRFKLVFVITIITALVVGFVLGGVYVYFTGVRSLESGDVEPSPTATPVFTPTPTPIPTPSLEEFDLSEYEVSILNGSGKIGEAGKVQDLLENEGFVVGETGNADSFDYTDTLIKAKETVPGVIREKIKEVLGVNYSSKISSEVLEKQELGDIQVIIGSL